MNNCSTLRATAAAKAYAPYSNFHVGCAIEIVDGEVVTGANMENACYRLGVCAEQSALTAAQHKFGLDKVARIAVVGGAGLRRVCTPCGGCRQAILEAAQLSGRDVEILCGSGDGSAVERHTIGELIPFGFGRIWIRRYERSDSSASSNTRRRGDLRASDQLDLAQPLLEVVVGGDRRPLRLLAGGHRLRQRLDQEIRAEVEEEGHRIARVARAVGRRVDDPVRGRAQLAVGQPLQHVADVDHQLAGLG